ncbi:MAG TPA: diacylglycerol kinase [Xanthomonadaceae bacterium]|nr:diacylglycerol kinase [Xanthomonadaceae bacterium]
MADSRGGIAPRGPIRIWRALTWSLKGLVAAWRHESSFRLEVYLFVILAPLGWWLGANGLERAILIGSLLLVLGAELFNSALEAAVDRWGAELHELSARAKDMGSAAVFVLMIHVIVCWGLIVGPRLL